MSLYLITDYQELINKYINKLKELIEAERIASNEFKYATNNLRELYKNLEKARKEFNDYKRKSNN